ncbi:MAG TPA: hypothetical protein VEC01_18385 [Noviherbaspirillum sp.]|uniref:hypothetical protein n=1 Tax=Noviherbaspirillum sp. TaxID=1926288 RepID=UPI002D55BD22|nr:hypothetical protein [Noviherbaspirillum sp.]HYD97299.1 hypothetical protein [Noviherbaspirillum sp.]
MNRLARGALYLLAILLAGSAHAAETLKDVLERVSAAYGKTPPAAMVEQGTTTSFRRGEGALLRQYRAPDRFSIRIRYATGSESRVLAGEQAWQQGAAANPILRGAIVLQVARIALPWNMLAQASALVDLGPSAMEDGKPLRAIGFPLEENLRLVVEVDAQDGRILRSRGIQRIGAGSMEFATVYSEFRHGQGRMHAAREEHYAMGQHTGFSVIHKVAYPESLPDDAFAP